jgi:Ser/Thr protein kinase RdoA (MazF antagonist)
MELSNPIAEILSRYPRPLQPIDTVLQLGNAGGLSGARLWKYCSAAGSLCLRAWPENSPGRPHLEQVHRWLIKARDLPFIPVPFPALDDQSLVEALGTFWELAPWMPGESDRSPVPSTARVVSTFGTLAAFHRALDYEQIQAASPGLMRRRELVEDLERGGLSGLRAAIEAVPNDMPEPRQLAQKWLSLARSVLPQLIDPLRQAAGRLLPLQPCLRDARGDHFLFSDDCVTGLVDFGAMGVDCVAADLARLMGDWLPVASDLRSVAVAAYDRVRPLHPSELAVVDQFESSADLLIGERWIRWHYVEKRSFNDPKVVIEGIRRGLDRLERRSSNLGIAVL